MIAPRTRRAAATGSHPCTKVRLAHRPAELRAALRLVHQTYVRSGFAKPNPFGMRVTPYHLLPTTEVFIATHDDEAVCTLTLVRDGELGLPMESIYGDEVGLRRASGVSLAEVSCLADRRQSSSRGLSVLIKIMSLMAQYAKRRGVAELLIAVHPRHAPFYQRFMGFEAIGPLKAYGTVLNNPALALALDLDRAAVTHPRAYKRFFGTPFPEAELAYRPISDRLQSQLSRIVEATYTPDADLAGVACHLELAQAVA